MSTECEDNRKVKGNNELAELHSNLISHCVCCQMLRTCSLPDLSRLFSAQQDSAASHANVVPDSNLEIEDLDEPAKDDDQSEPEE